ncbi:MAG: thiolase family protein [Gammaproteobacteria bacterium]|nr:thiolase family protein [Gammaproteobacteria bacterium]
MNRPVESYDGVALVAPVSLPYTRFSDRGAAWFIARTFHELLLRAGIQKAEVDGLAVSSLTLAPDTVVAMSECLDLSPSWIEHLPMGGAGGVIAVRRAARAVQAGDAEIVACIAGDTNGKDGFRDLVANFSRASTDSVYPYGGAGPNAVFAMITRHYMERFGATREDFGRICIAQRRNAMAYPPALLREPLSMEQYLAARIIAEPLHLYDCVMPCAGGEGFLVMSVDRARSLGLRHVRILSGAERHNAYSDDEVPWRGGWALYRDDLYAAASRGPQDIDILETYDDYPVIVMMQLEDLGFCAKGSGPEFVRNTELGFNDRGLPHNTCGGQLSAGQAGAAGGFLGTVEAVRQLTESGLPNQVPDAETALVSGYGMVNYDRCVCTAAAILARGE